MLEKEISLSSNNLESGVFIKYPMLEVMEHNILVFTKNQS